MINRMCWKLCNGMCTSCGAPSVAVALPYTLVSWNVFVIFLTLIRPLKSRICAKFGAKCLNLLIESFLESSWSGASGRTLLGIASGTAKTEIHRRSARRPKYNSVTHGLPNRLRQPAQHPKLQRRWQTGRPSR